MQKYEKKDENSYFFGCFNMFLNMAEENRRKVSIDIVKANIFALAIMVIAAIVLLVPFFLIWGGRKPMMELLGNGTQWIVAFVGMIIGIVVHELIHGITWACYAPSGWKSISFGVMWKMLTPYCRCDAPVLLCTSRILR